MERDISSGITTDQVKYWELSQLDEYLQYEICDGRKDEHHQNKNLISASRIYSRSMTILSALQRLNKLIPDMRQRTQEPTLTLELVGMDQVEGDSIVNYLNTVELLVDTLTHIGWSHIYLTFIGPDQITSDCILYQEWNVDAMRRHRVNCALKALSIETCHLNNKDKDPTSNIYAASFCQKYEVYSQRKLDHSKEFDAMNYCNQEDSSMVHQMTKLDPYSEFSRTSLHGVPSAKMGSHLLSARTGIPLKSYMHTYEAANFKVDDVIYDPFTMKQWTQRPSLAICFNAGLWGYQSWLPAIDCLLAPQARFDNQAIPFLITSYRGCEADADEDILLHAIASKEDALQTLENVTQDSSISNNSIHDSSFSEEIDYTPIIDEFGTKYFKWRFERCPYPNLYQCDNAKEIILHENCFWQCIEGN